MLILVSGFGTQACSVASAWISHKWFHTILFMVTLVPTISYNPLADIVFFWSSRPSKLHQISRFSPKSQMGFSHRQELKSAESCRPFPMGTAGRFKVSAPRVAVRAHPELRGKANKDFLGANVWGSSGDSLKISGVDKSSRDV